MKLNVCRFIGNFAGVVQCLALLWSTYWCERNIKTLDRRFTRFVRRSAFILLFVPISRCTVSLFTFAPPPASTLYNEVLLHASSNTGPALASKILLYLFQIIPELIVCTIHARCDLRGFCDAGVWGDYEAGNAEYKAVRKQKGELVKVAGRGDGECFLEEDGEDGSEDGKRRKWWTVWTTRTHWWLAYIWRWCPFKEEKQEAFVQEEDGESASSIRTQVGSTRSSSFPMKLLAYSHLAKSSYSSHSETTTMLTIDDAEFDKGGSLLWTPTSYSPSGYEDCSTQSKAAYPSSLLPSSSSSYANSLLETTHGSRVSSRYTSLATQHLPSWLLDRIGSISTSEEHAVPLRLVEQVGMWKPRLSLMQLYR